MSQKTPISRTLPLFVDATVRKHIERLGKCLPATVTAVNGSIVTVSFQVQGVQLPKVTMPLFGPEYIRYPVKVGDKGVCFAADTYIGAMSGLGGGTADMSRRGNLSTLVFLPIGNKNWTAPEDTNAVIIYGPDGVILRDSNSNSKITLTPNNIDANAKTNLTGEAGTEIQFTVGSTQFTMNGTSIVMVAGGNTVTLDSTGLHTTAAVVTGALTAASLTTAGALTAATSVVGGKDFATHKHSGVTTGGGNTGNPI